MLRKLTSSFLFASTKKTNNTMVYGMLFQAMQRFNSNNYAAEEQQQEQSFEKRQFNSNKPRGKRFVIKPEDYKSSVYIGNLDYATEWPELKAHVESVGAVKFATVGRDAEGRSKGYGIIVFASEQDAQNAVANLNNSELRGRRIKASEFQPRERTEDAPEQFQQQRAAREFGSRLNTRVRVPRDVKTVYVGNLQDKVSQEDVQNLLSTAGTIENIAYKVSKNGHFALVTFATKEEAEKAVQELNEKEINGQVIIVREDKKF